MKGRLKEEVASQDVSRSMCSLASQEREHNVQGSRLARLQQSRFHTHPPEFISLSMQPEACHLRTEPVKRNCEDLDLDLDLDLSHLARPAPGRSTIPGGAPFSHARMLSSKCSLSSLRIGP